MNELDSLKFSNRFAELPEDLFHKQNWTPFDKPKLIHFNEDLAKQLGFPKNLDPEDLVPYINGNKSFKNSSPLAWLMLDINLVRGYHNWEMAEVFY